MTGWRTTIRHLTIVRSSRTSTYYASDERHLAMNETYYLSMSCNKHSQPPWLPLWLITVVHADYLIRHVKIPVGSPTGVSFLLSTEYRSKSTFPRPMPDLSISILTGPLSVHTMNKRSGQEKGVETRKSPWWRTSRSRDFAYEEEERVVIRSLLTAGRRMVVASAEGAVPNDDDQRFRRTDPLFLSEASICFVVALLSVPLRVLHLVEPVMSLLALILNPQWVVSCTQKNAYPAIIDAFSPLLHQTMVPPTMSVGRLVEHVSIRGNEERVSACVPGGHNCLSIDSWRSRNIPLPPDFSAFCQLPFIAFQTLFLFPFVLFSRKDALGTTAPRILLSGRPGGSPLSLYIPIPLTRLSNVLLSSHHGALICWHVGQATIADCIDCCHDGFPTLRI
jgi:hypothetical protein